MRNYVIAAAAALLMPTVANAQDRNFVMPRGYEEVVPPEPSAAALYAVPVRRRETVTPVVSRPNLRLDPPPVVAAIPQGQHRFTRGIACSSNFEVMQIAQGLSYAPRGRETWEFIRESAIDERITSGTCERFENRSYVVSGEGSYGNGYRVTYLEAARTRDDTTEVRYPEGQTHVFLIFVER